MIIAAPLLIPFATAVGLPIAGLGAIEIGKKVQDFVDNNPEVSMEILTSLKDSLLMTLPGSQGLNALFKKKAKEDSDDESVEVAPEDRTKEERAKEMKKRFKEGKGDKREIGKKGFEEVIKPVKDIEDLLEGEERYDGSLEDAPKPKFDYKKFFRNRRADGGAIGIEVLFEEKKDGGRIGFANGGDNIIGQELKEDPYEKAKSDYQEKFAEAFEIGGKYPSNTLGPFVEQGMSSDMRHQLGSSAGKDAIIDYLSNFGIDPQGKFADTIGNLGIIGATAYEEIPDAFSMAKEAIARKDTGALLKGNFLAQPIEDVRSNLAAMQIPYGLTTKEKENFVLANYPNYAPNVTPTNYSYGTAGASPTEDFQGSQILETPRSDMVDANIGFITSPRTINDMVDANIGFTTSPKTNVQGRDLEADLGARINPDIQPSLNMFQRAGNFVDELNIEDYLPFIGNKSLTGMIGRGIGNLFRGIAPARYGYSTDTFNRMTPGQQSYTSSLYGPGGLLQGYNQTSAFGLGALGTLGNRLTYIQNRKAPQTVASLAKQQQIKDAINKTINIGESEALGDRNRSVDYGITGGPTRTDIDVADGGAETSGGKIVCTMMNESYGFGNFRNKIWLKHSRDLPKEYEIGYHTIFLPLVKFAKGKGKLNKVVKKTLEHVARHRTLDLKQEMKGKTHLLGRVYRKILEPICLMVGKIKKAVK